MTILLCSGRCIHFVLRPKAGILNRGLVRTRIGTLSVLAPPILSTPASPIPTVRPGMAPKRKRTSKPETLPEISGTPDDAALAAATAAVLALSEPLAGMPSPRRRASARAATRKVSYKESLSDADGGAESTKNEDRGESPLTDPGDELEEDTPKKRQKRTRRKKDSDPVVYDIPEVERKETQFTGRLGYACLNTLLRVRKPEPVFCSRTCRLDTIRKNGIEFAKDLGKRNATHLLDVIEWNEANKIRFFRVSSEMFPFASHKLHGYDLEYAREELKAAGALAKRYGHRLTTHPGQFTQLASPREEVVEASVRELEYHCQMMRYMELDQDSVIIIHMGGVYGDKETTLARFRDNYETKLTDEMKARVVLENDEMCYNPDDLLPVCEELSIPMVLDYHHNWIYPSVLPMSELLPRVAATWTRKGIRQKQHLSEPRPGAESVMEKRAHADRCKELPEVLVGNDIDLMIEAKDKEQAVLHLYRIYGLEPVIHANLRPEKPPKPFVRGKGRAIAGDELDGEGEAGENVAEQIDDGGEVTSTPRSKAKRKKVTAKEEGGEGEVGGESSVPSTPARRTRRQRQKSETALVTVKSVAFELQTAEEAVAAASDKMV